jgi:hypothetical protein
MVETLKKCQYCGSTLVVGTQYCFACGAPVEQTPARHKPTYQAVLAPIKTNAEKEAEQKKQEEILKQAAAGLESGYYFLWHSLAQIFAVGISAAALGIIGGATDATLWGILGAGLVGAVVGNAYKWALLEMFSAPLGLVLGSALGIIIWLVIQNNAVFVFTATLGAAGMAALGSRQLPFAYRSLWQKMRPAVGLLAGLTVGTLGALIGVGIRTAVMSLLGG